MSIEVFKEIKLVTISKTKIMSIASDATHVFVSCKDGRLLIYELINATNIQFRESGIIPNFSGTKKGAIAMYCVQKWDLLFALNDKGVAIHRLSNLNNYSYLPNTSGCSTMAIDEGHHIVVTSWKRKIYAYQLANGVPLSQSFLKEIILPDTILCMEFLNSFLFVGYKREYCLVDINQGRSCKDICDISKTTAHAFCTRIEQHGGLNANSPMDENEDKEQCEMLLSNERKGLFYDFVGSPARGKGQHLEWSSDAISGLYLCPYFLALTTEGVEIFNSWRYQRIQMIRISSPKMMSEAHFQIMDQLIDGAIVCTQQSVEVIRMQPLSEQIMNLISDQYKSFDDALTLCNLFPKGKEELRDQYKTEISRLKGLYLFSQGQYDSAVTFLQHGRVSTRQILSLYPFIIPSSLPSNISPYPPRVFKSRYEENQAVEAVMPLLNSRRQQLIMKLTQLKNINDPNAKTEGSDASYSYSSVIHLTMDNEDESQIKQDLELIDSVLIRAYIRTNRPAIIPLLRGENFCVFKDVQTLLIDAQMEPELITLYSSHHKHDLAIAQILSPLSNSNFTNLNHQKRLSDLLRYLQQLGSDYQDLIFDCSKMFYKESPQLVLELFVGYHPIDGGEPIPGTVILDHLHELSQNDNQLENQWEKNALEITYLRQLIWNEKVTESVYHTKLVILYTNSLSSLQENITVLKKKLEEMETSTDLQNGIDITSAKTEMKLLISQREELLLRSKKELLEFLELSDHYDATKLLQLLDGNMYLEEKAIILSKLGEYLKALSIIAHRLGNINMAEAYCMKVYNSDKNSDIFLHLIKTYLYPPETSVLSHEECIHLALQVFSNHSDKLDPIVVLNMLPDSIQLEDMVDCLEIIMTKLDETRRSALMLRQLAEVRRLDISEDYIHLRNSSFENTNTTVCPVCNRLIGDSIFTWHANGVITHTACAITK